MKLRDLPAMPQSVLGLPIVYDIDFPGIAEAIGLWPLKGIRVGLRWFGIAPEERTAVLYHEAGHCKLWHAEKRLLWSLWMTLEPRRVWRILSLPDGATDAELLKHLPDRLRAVSHQHEIEADAFAARMGYADGLLAFLNRHADLLASPLHPSPAERVQRILESMDEETSCHHEAKQS
jgi:Peptidase family M48